MMLSVYGMDSKEDCLWSWELLLNVYRRLSLVSQGYSSMVMVPVVPIVE